MVVRQGLGFIYKAGTRGFTWFEGHFPRRDDFHGSVVLRREFLTRGWKWEGRGGDDRGGCRD